MKNIDSTLYRVIEIYKNWYFNENIKLINKYQIFHYIIDLSEKTAYTDGKSNHETILWMSDNILCYYIQFDNDTYTYSTNNFFIIT